jgi:hypothetical protein
MEVPSGKQQVRVSISHAEGIAILVTDFSGL